jgi:hypothetical protein
MAKLRPIKRKDLIRSLRQLDFTGPYAGGKHEYMQRGRLKVHIPIRIRMTLASHCSNAFLKKRMFPYRNGNNYEVSLTHPTRHAFYLTTFIPHTAPVSLASSFLIKLAV